MRSHMDVFHYLTYVRQQLDLNTREILPFLERSFDMPGMVLAQADHIIDLYSRYPPTNTQIAQYMREKGFQPGHIARFLQIAQGTVSYHLGRQDPKTYTNGVVEGYVRNIRIKAYKE